jgi:hypothetical protein
MATILADHKPYSFSKLILLVPLTLAIVVGYIRWEIYRHRPEGELRHQQELSRFQQNIEELKAGKTDLLMLTFFRDSDSLLEGIRGMPEIKAVHINDSHITVAGMRHLATFPNLRSIESYGGPHDTGHSDEGILELRECKNLKTIAFWGGLSDEGIAELKRQMPNLRVITKHP